MIFLGIQFLKLCRCGRKQFVFIPITASLVFLHIAETGSAPRTLPEYSHL